MSFVIPSTQEDTQEMFVWLANQIVERSSLAHRVRVLEVDLDAVALNRDSARCERDGAYQEVSRLAGIVNQQATEIESLRGKVDEYDRETRGMKVDAERNAVQFKQLEANRDWWIEQAKMAEEKAASLQATLDSTNATLNDVRSDLSCAHSLKDSANAAVSHLQETIKINNDQFAESLKAKDDALNELTSQVNDLTWRLNDSKELFNQEQERNRELTTELMTARKERDVIQMVMDKIEAAFASFRAPPVSVMVNPPVQSDPSDDHKRDNVVGF